MLWKKKRQSSELKREKPSLYPVLHVAESLKANQQHLVKK